MPNGNNTPNAKVTQPKENQYFSRRPLLQTIASAGAIGLASGLASADHPTEECAVTIEFNRAQVARVFDVQSAGLTSLTIFYFDRDHDAQKREEIAPTTNDKYGSLRVRYDSDEDQTTIQIGGRDSALRRVVAYGPNCRSAKTNPLDSAAGENDAPTADFTWDPDPPAAGKDVVFTSTAADPDGEFIHYGWDFDDDGTEDATGEEVTHTFDTAGEHDVTHIVIDDFDATDSVTLPVTVEESWRQAAKLVSDDGESRDNFGSSVTMDGDTVIIGASSDDTDREGFYFSGSAYVFTRADGSWSQQQKLLPSESDVGFGSSGAMDGDTVIIGAPIDPAEVGSAYVFTRADGTWNQRQKLIADDGDIEDQFGSSVAVSGDTVIVGAPLEDPNGEDAGSAYAFTRVGGSWSQQQKLTPKDGDRNDRFGEAVAVDGNTAIIGAKYDEKPNGDRTGAAYVFTRSDGSWSQQQKLTADDGDSGDTLGVSVAMDGDTAVIGAYHDEDPNGYRAGSAYVFTRSNGSWSQQQKLTADDGDSGDFFGLSVAVDGDTAVIGAYHDEDPNGDEAGSAYVFTRSDGSWNQQQKLTAEDGDENDEFGLSVAVDGDTAVAGARYDENPNGDRAGSAYVFRE